MISVLPVWQSVEFEKYAILSSVLDNRNAKLGLVEFEKYAIFGNEDENSFRFVGACRV